MDFFAVTVWDHPIENYPFIIEREELRELRQGLLASPSHTAAIQGAYGVGKTFLAKLYSEKYRAEYPGGIQYFSSPLEAQDYIERGLEPARGGGPALYIIDETASLRYDTFNLRKFNDKYIRLFENSNIHVLLIGQTVPEILIRGGAAIDLKAMTEEELHSYMRSYIQELAVPEDIWADAVKKSQGNMRELYSILYLLQENKISDFKSIIHQSGILGADGRPLKKKGNPIEIDVRTVNVRLLDELARNPELLYSLTSRQLEFLIAGLIEKEGYHVMVTKATRDGGADIYAAKKDRVGSFLFLVECKKNSPTNRVGVNVVRNLYGVMQHERATYSMVATTSFFTKGAVEFQKTIPHQMSLCDYYKLIKWLRAHT